jgi:hypothetical protein
MGEKVKYLQDYETYQVKAHFLPKVGEEVMIDEDESENEYTVKRIVHHYDKHGGTYQYTEIFLTD